MTQLYRAQFQGLPVELFLAESSDEARELFELKRFDAIALDGIAPSATGKTPSLVGPKLALEFREKGYAGPIIAISSEPQAQALIRQAAQESVRHKAYACSKAELFSLTKELLGF